MRIIAGTLKNRRIKSREGRETRPTLERIKEAIFSIIGEKVAGAKFLDFYSGTGNVTFEALSRGAERAIMIEEDKDTLRVIIENVNHLGVENKCRAYKNDVFRAAEILARKNEKFDIIFMDPPYQDNVTKKVLKVIDKANILAEDGLIICEHHLLEDLEDNIASFRKTDERKYNKKILTFYTK